MAADLDGKEPANVWTRAGLLVLIYQYLVLITVLAVLFAAGHFWNSHENAIGSLIITGEITGVAAMIVAFKAQRGRKAAIFLLALIPLVIFGMLTFVPL